MNKNIYILIVLIATLAAPTLAASQDSGRGVLFQLGAGASFPSYPSQVETVLSYMDSVPGIDRLKLSLGGGQQEGQKGTGLFVVFRIWVAHADEGDERPCRFHVQHGTSSEGDRQGKGLPLCSCHFQQRLSVSIRAPTCSFSMVRLSYFASTQRPKPRAFLLKS